MDALHDAGVQKRNFLQRPLQGRGSCLTTHNHHHRHHTDLHRHRDRQLYRPHTLGQACVACCIFGTFISTNKMFTLPASATANVVSTASRPCATGVKETTVARTRTVRVSARKSRPLCSSSARKN